MILLTCLGIAFCLSQSAMFAGLNIALFRISRLRLEVESTDGDKRATRLLELRKDSNFLLTTIIWGNVGINVLFTILTNSLLTGLTTFVFSTVLIALFAEILPQAWFSQHTLTVAWRLSPLIRFYQLLLYPVAKPTALMLDKWVGPETMRFFSERQFEDVLRMHVRASHTDIDEVEARGALNFLLLDDIPLSEEGEIIDPNSIVALPFASGQPRFPAIQRQPDDPLLARIHACGRKWIVITDEATGKPCGVLNADDFLRAALFGSGPFHPEQLCLRPIVSSDPNTTIGDMLLKLHVDPQQTDDDVIDDDVAIFWGSTRRIITGADILGRLLRGIARRMPLPDKRQPDKQ